MPSALDHLQQIQRGEFPAPPVADLIGFTLTSVARRAACAQCTVFMSSNAHWLSRTVLSSISKTLTRFASIPIHPCLPGIW